MKPIRLGLTRDQRAYLALSKARRNVARGEQQARDARAVSIQASRALLELRKLFSLADSSQLRVRGALLSRDDVIAEIECYARVGR